MTTAPPSPESDDPRIDTSCCASALSCTCVAEQTSNTLSVHCGLGWTQKFSSRELFLVSRDTERGHVFGTLSAKQLQHNIKILRIAFNGHHSIEPLAETFQMIVFRTFVMNAAITGLDVGHKVLLELLNLWVWPKTVHLEPQFVHQRKREVIIPSLTCLASTQQLFLHLPPNVCAHASWSQAIRILFGWFHHHIIQFMSLMKSICAIQRKVGTRRLSESISTIRPV